MQSKVPISENLDWIGLDLNRERPSEVPVMLQEWHHLLFLHARLKPEILIPYLPEGLELQTYEGDAWLGFVPFEMRKVRPARSPVSMTFRETNLRTYVTHPVHGPGVWFFSLDADKFIACLIARLRFSLPYFYSALFLENQDRKTTYMGTRIDRQRLPMVWEKSLPLKVYNIEATRLEAFAPAMPGTLEYWLAERYCLYAADKNGRLTTARVWHMPYQLAAGRLDRSDIQGLDSMLEGTWFNHVMFADAVNVEAFKPLVL